MLLRVRPSERSTLIFLNIASAFLFLMVLPGLSEWEGAFLQVHFLCKYIIS
jgi:hypothetical protein